MRPDPTEFCASQGGADTATEAQQGSGRCAIKGNISRDGARIYHVPGGRYYERTRINRSKGRALVLQRGPGARRGLAALSAVAASRLGQVL